MTNVQSTTMAGKRKEPSSPADASARPDKKTKNSGHPSSLIPIGPRTRAMKGVKDEKMLHMLCDDLKSGKQKELHFKKLVHSQIDWNSAADISKINGWRNQLYGRGGIRAKHVVMWHADEEAFLELYWHLLVVHALKTGMMIPKAKDVLEDFNAFFAGRVMQDKDGDDLEPREVRKHNAFVSKMNRVIGPIKERLEMVCLGKSGDVFRPKITEGMLECYKKLKEELEEIGIMGELYEPRNEDGNDSDVIEHWRAFFSRLPETDDVEMEDDEGEVTLVGEGVEPKEGEAGKDAAAIDKDVSATDTVAKDQPSSGMAQGTHVNTNGEQSELPTAATDTTNVATTTPAAEQSTVTYSDPISYSDDAMPYDEEATLVEEVKVYVGQDPHQTKIEEMAQEKVALVAKENCTLPTLQAGVTTEDANAEEAAAALMAMSRQQTQYLDVV